jgi:hypothetical protein
MKFYSTVVGFFAVLGCTEVSAFSPTNFVSNKSGLMVPSTSKEQQQQQSPLWRPPMNMVAGGAERAYGQEYYEGACVYDAFESVIMLYFMLWVQNITFYTITAVTK